MLQRVSYFRSTWCHFPLVLFVIGQCPLRQTDHIVPFFNRHHNPRTSETNQPPTMAIPIWILSPAVYHPRWAFRCCYFVRIHPRCNFLPSVHCRWGQYRHIHVIIVSPNFHAHRRFTAPSFLIWDFITSFFPVYILFHLIHPAYITASPYTLHCIHRMTLHPHTPVRPHLIRCNLTD